MNRMKQHTPITYTIHEEHARFINWIPPFIDVLKEKGGSATAKEVNNGIADKMKLSEKILSERHEKSGQLKFSNQVYWAKQYLAKLAKNKFQNRARNVIILVRLDIDGPPHRNPDGEELPGTHLHIYRPGAGDKWACLPPDNFKGANSLSELLQKFDEIFYHV